MIGMSPEDKTPRPPHFPMQPPSPSRLRSNLWLLANLLRREIRDRYVGTATGLGWVLLQPLLMLAIYSFVFSYVFRIRLPGSDNPLTYVVFVAVALWPWFLLQEGLVRAMGALRAQAALIRKTALSRELPVLASVLASCLIHLTGYALVLTCLALAGGDLQLRGLPLLGFSVASLILIVLALGYLSSILQLVWRDLEHAVSPVFGILFYATPILYPLQLVPESLRPYVALNPLGWWLERLRDGLLRGALPGIVDIAALLAAAALLLLARAIFLRVATHAEDLL